jgi:hypothetical protein
MGSVVIEVRFVRRSFPLPCLINEHGGEELRRIEL